MLNIITIHAIRKTSLLSNTLKTFLLSLAVSDVGVGLVVQPFFTSILVRVLQHSIPGCPTYRAFDVISHVFSGASFFGVIALSVEVLSYSYSSQIPGTCDSQACYCRGHVVVAA